MAVPDGKDALLEAIDDAYARLMRELATIPADRTGEKTLDGHAKGTRMSVRDLVAYLTGWNELVLKWHTRRDAGEPVDFPETGYKWNQLGALAQKFYADYDGLSFEQLLQRLAQAKDRLVALIERHDDAALYGTPWYESYTMGRMIQFNTSSPYANARGRLRTWKKANGIA
ncbi:MULTISPECIES: ClbS/DfsB family four-helix bundle protein [Kaistia]|uniref:ClbS/DfsB family four-helix bundle protein n=1 Tax=Kaistia nematophila TaxID=2994654 RepID=A0A9X3E554_9HYPH|nr:ClbS/DfsB family four-helix bundle protein [Kaistia nematophila]MCX5571313.1 ClbS/DfsB family four-helix bundle protein [Kaistia nematophila]